MTESTTDSIGLVLMCSDHRIKMWKGIKTHLLKGRMFTQLGLLGLPTSLANPQWLPQDYGAIMDRQIPFALKNFPGIREIMVVGHDCGYYSEIPTKKNFTAEEKKRDLRKAITNLREHFPNLKVTAFFANASADRFERVGRRVRRKQTV